MRTGQVLPWILLISLISATVSGQVRNGAKYPLYLRNGTIHPAENIGEVVRNGLRTRADGEEGKRFVIIQFHDIPPDDEKKKLYDAGVELLEYVPEYAYTATITGNVNPEILAGSGIRSIVELAPEQKMQPELLTSDIPPHAQPVPGKVDVRVCFLRSFSVDDVKAKLQEGHIELLSDKLKDYEILLVRIDEVRLKELADLPFVQYVEIAPGETQPLNDKSAANTKANVLTSQSISGKGLSGKGVVVGVGDVGSPYDHIDIRDRLLRQVTATVSPHGVHITGTVAGSGIMNERYAGYAPKADLIFYQNSEIWNNAPQLVKDFNMVVTNNSYGGESYGGCLEFGLYTSDSYILDRQAFDLPYLQHVFAAGNSGLSTICNQYPAGFGNVLSDFASAKNVMSVGQTLTTGFVAPSSSKGPVRDGRVKPEVTAPGTSILSTTPGNTYLSGTGTSMAAPAISGGLALLYERYRQLHGQATPKSALMKALICNGASDQGLTGPDYSYGFGNMNLLRSCAMLDKGHYVQGQLTHRASQTHSISVPANTARLKVMLYWHDRAASMLTGEKTLVNNLDLLLKPSVSAALKPVFPVLSNPTQQAVAGVDTVNNMEQIVIENPAAGTYEINVTAEKIPDGTQEYFVVYDVIEQGTTVTYPIGGEHLVRGDIVNINWESYGNNSSAFGVYYSLNNGASWVAVNASVPPAARQLSWTVPDAATGTARIRITQNDTGLQSDSEPFTILGVPAVSLSPVQCESYVAVQWTSVSGATDYEVMLLRDGEMRPVAITNALNYALGGLSRDSLYYVSVRARKDGVAGRRALAVSRTPASGTCAGSISNNDLAIDSIISPQRSGRLFTSYALSNATQITVGVKNLDDQVCSPPFELGYSVGGESAPVHWETVQTAIPALGYLSHTFAQTANFASPGVYPVRVFIRKADDPVQKNNFTQKVFRQNSNPVLSLPYLETVESMAGQQITESTVGFTNGDAYDFHSSQSNGRLRTAAGPGIAYSGSKAFTLDADDFIYNSVNVNYLTGTYNLSAYKVAGDEVRLSFRYKNHGQSLERDNGVYVRGSDKDQWILVYQLLQNQNPVSGEYKFVSIGLSEMLKANGQEFSSSSQIRWTQSGDDFTLSPSSRQGYSFDDIRLSKSNSDMELLSITPPAPVVCGSTLFGVAIAVRNNDSEDAYDVRFRVRVDGGNDNDDTIPFIPAHGETSFYFNQPVYDVGSHEIDVSINKPYDLHPENNAGSIVITRQPTIVSYPYLENFERGSAGWQGHGSNSSWAYGTPLSPNTRQAASGSKAWKTNLTGNYNANEASYLYSPCFYISGMGHPTVSFSARMNTATCQGGKCDVVYVEYLLFGGTWKRLGQVGSGTNWYNATENGEGVWSNQNDSRWHVCTVPLPNMFDQYIMFRFVVKSSGGSTGEGVAIDDFHVYDLTNEIYESGGENTVVDSDLGGSYWTNFIRNQRVIAAIYPDRYLGSTTVKTFLNNRDVRSSNGHYYLDRSYTIKAENGNFTDSVAVRLFFTDNEVKRLVEKAATPSVERTQSAYELAVTKYSGAREDGDLTNDANEAWAFHPASKVTKVPYGKGYYVEFKTRSFSEFWLAKGYIGSGSALPVTLTAFSARRSPTPDLPAAIQLDWATASERDFHHFDIEVASGDDVLGKNAFLKIGTIEGRGGPAEQQHYSFTDRLATQLATRYYRLKMVDVDSSYRYSAIRPVTGADFVEPVAFPNPSAGIFHIDLPSGGKSGFAVNVLDIAGRQVKTERFTPTQGRNLQQLDLSGNAYPSGLYIIEMTSGEQKYNLKVTKQ
nr:S8 family serine peptidase [uncultured Dyadobacter sp.]